MTPIEKLEFRLEETDIYCRPSNRCDKDDTIL